MVRRHVREPDKERVAHGLPYLEILKGRLKDSIFYQATQNGARTATIFAHRSNMHIKEFWILISECNNSLRAPWKRCAKIMNGHNRD